MGTGSKSQPSVYDLSDKSLAAQKKFLDEMHMVEIQSLLEPGKDEKSVLYNKKNLENALTTLHNHLHKDLKPILEKHRVTEEDLKILNDEKFFKDFKLNTMLKSLKTRILTEEAIAIFTHHEQMREKLIALKALLHKLAEAEYAWQVYEAETERMKYEDEINKLMLDELDRRNQKAQGDWDKLDGKVKVLEEEIKDLKSQRLAIAQKHVAAMSAKTESFKPTTGKNPFDSMSKQQIDSFNLNYIQQSHIHDRRIEHAKRSKAKSEKNLPQLEKQLEDRINDIKQSVGTQVSAKQRKDQASGMFLTQRNLGDLSSDPIEHDPTVKSLKKEIAKEKKNIKAQDKIVKDEELARSKTFETVLAKEYRNEILKDISVNKAREVVSEKVSPEEAGKLSEIEVREKAAEILGTEKAAQVIKDNPNIQAEYESHHKVELGAAHKDLHALNDSIYDKKEEVVKTVKEQEKLKKENADLNDKSDFAAPKANSSSLADRLKKAREAKSASKP
jgi:cell division protein FtsB